MTTVIKFDITELAETPRGQRLAYVREHEAQLDLLSHDELSRVATLILVESPRDLKLKYPIETDSKRDFDVLLVPSGDRLG